MTVCVLRGGPVLTLDRHDSVAEAISICDGRIQDVGKFEHLLSRAGSEATVQELPAGCAVVPGFIDAHHHMSLAALYQGAIDCGSRVAPSLDALQHTLKDAVCGQAEGQWAIGAGFDERRLRERRFPTLDELDAMCPFHPLILVHYGHHACLLNRRALRELEIDASTPDPPAGRYVRDRRGQLTGLLHETAMSEAKSTADRELLERDRAGAKTRLASHAKALLAVGVTRVADATVSPVIEAWYRELHAAGELPLPVVMMAVGNRGYLLPPVDRLEGPVTGDGDDVLRVGPLKLFADGGDEMAIRLRWRHMPGVALNAVRSTLLTDVSFLDELKRFHFRVGSDLRLHAGTRFLQGEASVSLARTAVERGFSLAIHAIGNEAIDDALDLIERVRPWHRDEPPPRIEHGFLANEAQLERAAALGVAVVFQPALTSLAPGVESPLPDAPILGMRTALDKGVRIAGSSDHPVVGFDPLPAMRVAVTRTWADAPPVHRDQAITMSEALTAYTRDAAFACGCLDVVGTLEPGKRADLVVLSADPTKLDESRLDELEVVETFLGGESVYRRA